MTTKKSNKNYINDKGFNPVFLRRRNQCQALVARGLECVKTVIGLFFQFLVAVKEFERNYLTHITPNKMIYVIVSVTKMTDHGVHKCRFDTNTIYIPFPRSCDHKQAYKV